MFDTHPIRMARTVAGLTQTELAAAVGVTKASVSAWELRRSLPAPEVAILICRALPRLTLEQIYGQRVRRRRRAANDKRWWKA